MSRFVVDASVAIKWVVREQDSGLACALLDDCRLYAPDLLVAECSNILWKKARRGELSTEHGMLAAQLLEAADIEVLPTRHLLQAATRLALDLDHPAYDCLYVALAVGRGCPLVTADERLRQRVEAHEDDRLAGAVLSLRQAAARQRPGTEVHAAN